VRPIVVDVLGPDVPHAAALIGPGSEVLGYDTERSRDHDWGPRCLLFVGDADARRYLAGLTAALAARLPARFLDWPTRFCHGGGTTAPQVHVHALGSWWRAWAGVAPGSAPTATRWLSLPTQRLLELTAGAVFHDGAGDLTAARARLMFYPDDLWRYALACTWARIGEEHAFVGRCGEVGDQLGAAVVAARIARDVMRLWLLMERRYPPYSKWLGTAFAHVAGTGAVSHSLGIAVAAASPAAREEALLAAMSSTVERHNLLADRLGHPPVDPTPRYYFSRPYRIVDVEAVVAGLRARIADPRLAAERPVAALDAFVDNVGVVGDLQVTERLVSALRPDR